MFRAIFFFCLGVATTYFAAGHHVVKASTGTLIVPRAEIGFGDIYVDITQWKAADFSDHPKLVQALIKGGHGDLVAESARDEVWKKITDIFKGSK